MFLALRDILHARGRFTLIAAVVGLITLLVVMLTGLTGGLGKQNTSALEALDPAAVVLTEDTYTASRITSSDLADWGPGAVPLGTGQTTLTDGDKTVSVAILGLPAGHEVPGGGTVPAEGVLVPADMSVSETVTLGGVEVDVVGQAETEYYSHSPVVWAATDTWAASAHVAPGTLGTALLLDHEADGAMSLSESFSALPAYQSEQGSLQMMQGFLYAISALVTISFLTVWTIQRTRDLAVLRALGASPRYLLKDCLGQAVIVLVAGAGLGALIGWGLGVLASQAVPFLIEPATVLFPAVGIIVLGLLGALVATRRVTKINPLTALGAAA